MKKGTLITYNPFENNVQFMVTSNIKNPAWVNLASNSELHSFTDPEIKVLFSNIAEGIVNIISNELNTGNDGLEIQFCGPDSDYRILERLAAEENQEHPEKGDLTCKHIDRYLSANESLQIVKNAYDRISNEFYDYLPGKRQYTDKPDSIGNQIVSFNEIISNEIPICIIGNYSVGKSAFINALIGSEILPSKVDPSTAKNVKVVRSFDGRYYIKLYYRSADAKTQSVFEYEIIDHKLKMISTAGPETDDAKGLMDEITVAISNKAVYPKALKDRSSSEILHDILDVMNDTENTGLLANVKWNLIITVPFVESALTKTNSTIVFYDTPGSNNAILNQAEHKMALEELMTAQTNALPILMTTKDNAASNDVSEIKSLLDEYSHNFSAPNCLVVIAKADLMYSGQLREQIPELLTSWHGKSPVLYVTQIGAIGDRKSDKNSWIDSVYKEAYRSWQHKFDDDPFVYTLPTYNVVPCQGRNIIDFILSDKVIDDIKSEAAANAKKAESPQTRQAEQEETVEKIGLEMPAFSLDNGIVIETNCVPFMDRMNHVGIDELYIENNTDQLLENYRLEIESIPGFCLTFTKSIAQISPHRGLTIRNIDITVDEEKLTTVSEETFCYLSIILKKGNDVIAEERADLDIDDAIRAQIRELGAGIAAISFEYNENELNINPDLQEDNRIYVPCGLGTSDNGFFINGLTKARFCTHQYADIYALVYNYMIRESRMEPNRLPVYLKKLDLPYSLDYRTIFRLAIILLQMIKNNYAGTELAVRYIGNADDLKYASGLITDYACRFARLLKISFKPVKITSSVKGYQISVEHRAGIYVTNNTELHTCAREMWFGRKLRYHLNENDKDDLLYILEEISGFDCFREGQFEALSSMISTDKNAVSIMPTGSGKSLIFYMASLLQPLPVMIVEPTDILITDQIRNLKKIHNIDNAAHLIVTDSFDFSGYDIHNSLNYLTPETLTNRNLFSSFIHKFNIGENLKSEKIAPGPMMAYFILDEIHCISNWGHDFRPEYLMISKNLGKYLDHVQIWGFTGTANFTVVEDIQKQLSVPTDNFFSPIQFEKYNVTYDFRECPSKKALYQEVASVLDECRARNERTIIFTKNDRITELVTKAVDYTAMPFSHNDLNAYTQFSEGYIDSLISSEELGIGINFPNIKNVIHFGIPLSKNEYVQEIGRAGRSNERVRSYVLYLSDNKRNAPEGLISRELDINRLPDMIKHIDNDYSDIFHKLTGNISRKEELLQKLLDLKKELSSSFRSAMLISAKSDEQLISLKRNLYMLYVCGFVEDWYTYGSDIETGQTQVYVRIPEERSEKKLKTVMQEKLRTYLSGLGTDNQREMVKATLAKSTDDIIRIYVDWYYAKYLYRNNEEFIDMFDFIKGSSKLAADDVTDQIKDYFALPFTVMLDEETEYNAMNLRQIAEKSVVGFSRTTLANVERINSSKYSYKLDFMLLCGELRANGKLNTSRLERVLHSMPSGERSILDSIFEKVYPACSTEGKLAVLNYLEVYGKRHHIVLDDFIENVYRNNEYDDIYYAMIARRLNKLFAVRRL